MAQILVRHVVPRAALRLGNGMPCVRSGALSMRSGPFEFELDLSWDPELCKDSFWRSDFDALYGAENFGGWASPAPTASQLAALLNTDRSSTAGGPPKFSYGSPVSQSSTSLTYALIGGTWTSAGDSGESAIRIVGYISLLWDPDLSYWQWQVVTTNVLRPCYRDAFLTDGTVVRITSLANSLRLESAQLYEDLRPGTMGISLTSSSTRWNVSSAVLRTHR